MDMKVPDGQYVITFDVQEGRVVKVRTTAEAAHLIHQLMIVLALVMRDLVAICITKESISGYEIINPDGSKGNFEDVYYECCVRSKGFGQRAKYLPCVYFLESDSRPGFVKIGQTKYPDQRASQLQGDIFHQIPCIVSDPEEHETTLHNLFTYFGRERRGEWFRLTEQDIAYIKSLKTFRDIAGQLEPFCPAIYSGRAKQWWDGSKNCPDYLR